jgi:hypothetical protein
MSNRKVKVWLVLLILVVSSMLVYRWLTAGSNEAELLDATTQAKSELIDTASLEEKTKPITDNSALPQFSETEIETILSVLQPHTYHQDPYVEAKIIFELKSHCKYKTPIEHKCDEVMNRFNKLQGLLTNFQDLQKIPTSTDLGQTIKVGAHYDPQQPEVFRHQARNLLKMVIKSKNAYVLGFEAFTFQFIGVDYGEILPFTQWLNSQDQEYNRVVLVYSLLKMASLYETFESNGSNVFFEQVLCSFNRSVCGSDFEDTFQKLVLPGMQKDVDLIITHLEQFADSGD